MNWGERELDERESGGAPGHGGRTLVSRVDALIEQQKRTWPLLANGYSALAHAETKPLVVEKSEVFAQHNPGRIKSTSAKVDKDSVERRLCFLCVENLPPEERAVSYGEGLVIMCNPFPILDHHLSIVHRDHIPQEIRGNVGVLLSLARDLTGRFFVLFNGAECGASAPDHLHFQACSRKLLPIEKDLGRPDSAEGGAKQAAGAGPVEVLNVPDCGRHVIVFRGSDQSAVERAIRSSIGALSRITGRPEPMINLIATVDEKGREFSWTVYLFPRGRHRPSCFFSEAEDRLMVSPGAIDMAGVIVVPEASDYRKIDSLQVRRIYREVTLADHLLREVMESIAAERDGRISSEIQD
ncbi:MAG TPA: DUF4922 domain-containing protein [Blastocatellia bacterium]|nr:DUF4922 domain-containing protein [Blastocatellia bacterium]